MLSKVFRQGSEQNRLVRLALVLALLFAALHVALHDLGLRGGSDEQCQVCSLNHVPVVSFATPSLIAPLNILAYLRQSPDTDYQVSHQFHVQRARAPPLLF